MSVNLLEHFYIVGTATSLLIGLLVAVLVFHSRKNIPLNHTNLALLLIALSMSVASNSILHVFLSRNYPFVGSFPEPFQLLFGPFIYFYLNKLNKKPMAKTVRVLHLLPFVLVFWFFVVFMLNQQNTLTINGYLAPLIRYLSFAAYLQLWLYYFFSRRQLKTYREKLKQSCSTIEKINQAWVKHSLFLLVLCYTIFSFLYLANHGIYHLPINKSLAIVIALIIILIVYRTLRQTLVAIPLRDQANPQIAEQNSKVKYKKSGLKHKEALLSYAQLEKFMQQHKPFIKPELNLNDLADRLGLSTHHLSQLINHGSNSNFYDFINAYRVEEFKQRISDPNNQQATLISIALDVGFNSKATFNRIFKKATSQTPSHYRKSIHPNKKI